MTKLTILTAAYNSAATIADTLRSVAEQRYPDIEHIVIDGASKDDTLAIVEREGARVTKLVSEPDKGIYDAYNKGIGLANGEIIGFLNSDDFYCHAGVLDAVMAAFAADPDLDAVHADLVYVDQADTTRVTRHWRSRPCTKASLRRGYIPAHPTVFLRRRVYDKAGLFDIKYRLAADYEFLLRIYHTHRVKSLYVPEIWVRMREGGATGGTFASIKKQNDEIRDAQARHGVHYALPKYYARKVIDRTLQRMRARFVSLPETAS